VRLGKVRGNLMIDVRATNAKLRDRAMRLVCELEGCSREEARTRLEAAGWSVRGVLGEH
jgi:N-acetylmuramic acid 6-phosphate etherase